jgi:hypothetical protein
MATGDEAHAGAHCADLAGGRWMSVSMCPTQATEAVDPIVEGRARPARAWTARALIRPTRSVLIRSTATASRAGVVAETLNMTG